AGPSTSDFKTDRTVILLGYFAMSLSALRGRTRTLREAGLAGRSRSWPRTMTPLRAGCGGLLTTLIFTRPGKAMTPGPFFPMFLPTRLAIASRTLAICFLLSSVDSANVLRISDLLIDLGFTAAIFTS